jgi:hypothetical protein
MMKGLPFRVWYLVTITPVFAAIIIRIIWELAVNYSRSGLIMSVLVIIGVLGAFGLIAYLILKPSRKLFTSLPVWTGIVVLMAGGVIGAGIHVTRFLPSPQSELPWSLVLALLYGFAMLSAYCILLLFVWSLWKKKRRKE